MSQDTRPGGDTTVEEETVPPPAPVMESLVMSVAHHWHMRETAARQVELLERHFRQDEMLAALKELEQLVKIAKVQPRRSGTGRTASKAQAEDVVQVIKQLGDRDELPRFTIQSDDLRRVAPLLGALGVSDERGVAARLEALELSQRQGMEEMKKMVAAVARGALVPTTTPIVPVIEVTAPPTFAAVTAEGRGGAGGGVGAGVGEGGRARVAQDRDPRGQLFFTRGRQEGRLQQVGMTQVNQGRQDTRQDRSSSAGKRQRTGEDEFQERRPRRSGGRQQRPLAPVIKGTSEEFPELAGPVTFWVGKCRPELDETRIKEIIMHCAESCEVKDFSIESIKCLTKEPNPWTKSFKVSVPAKFEEVMSSPRMYLGSWEARPFTRWPSRKQGYQATQQQGPLAPKQQGHQAPQDPQQQGLLVEAAAAPAGEAHMA